MDNILLNTDKYENLASTYKFNETTWDKEKSQCLKDIIDALMTFTDDGRYVIELSTGKEACININPEVNKGRIRERTAGIYVAPTKGIVNLVLNNITYVRLQGVYKLPEYYKFKNNQYHYKLSFCELCSFVEAITLL